MGCLAPRTDIKPCKDNLLQSLTNPSPRHRAPANIKEWRRWFCHYSSIYTAKFYKASGPMFEYVLRVEGLVNRFPNTVIWRMYDEEFRRAKPSKPWLEWHKLSQSVLDSVCEEHRAWVKHNRQDSQAQGQKQGQNQAQSKPKHKRGEFPNNGSCHHWNNRDCTKQKLSV